MQLHQEPCISSSGQTDGSRVSFLDEPKATHYSRAASRRPAPIRSPYSFRESSSPYTALKDPIHVASCQSACAPQVQLLVSQQTARRHWSSLDALVTPPRAARRISSGFLPLLPACPARTRQCPCRTPRAWLEVAAKSRRVLLQPSTDWGVCTRLCRGPAPSALRPSNTADEMYWGTGWVSCAGTQDELIKPMTDRCIKNCGAIRCRGASKFSSCD